MSRSHLRPAGRQPELWEKAVVAIGYLLLGFIVSRAHPGEFGSLITIFMVLGFLYWLLIARNRYKTSEYLRYHILQALMLNIALAAALWLLVSFLGMLEVLPLLTAAIDMVLVLLFAPIGVAGFSGLSVKSFAVMVIAVILIADALRGNLSRIPYVSDGVRHWV
ncbi:MAG: hypothetical protein KC476_01005 [Cyanobacteria bacterium HKST-UBA06]|nr:hypothetical protein [Cyanobacteria bacterium HKST-UBA06]